MSEKSKRPVWVWIITIYFLFGLIFGIGSFFLVSNGVITNVPQRTKDLITDLNILDWSIMALLACINIFACYCLFMLKKSSSKYFLYSLILALLNLVYTTVISKAYVKYLLDMNHVEMVSTLIGNLLAVFITFLIYRYTKRLVKKDVLN
jgi:hypothetical protein